MIQLPLEILSHTSRDGLYVSSDVFDPIRLTIKIKPSQHYKILLNNYLCQQEAFFISMPLNAYFFF